MRSTSTLSTIIGLLFMINQLCSISSRQTNPSLTGMLCHDLGVSVGLFISEEVFKVGLNRSYLWFKEKNSLMKYFSVITTSRLAALLKHYKQTELKTFYIILRVEVFDLHTAPLEVYFNRKYYGERNCLCLSFIFYLKQSVKTCWKYKAI